MMDDLGNVRRWLVRFGMDVESNPMPVERGDPLSAFLSATTIGDVDSVVSTRVLYAAFAKWQTYLGQSIWTPRGFSHAMASAGFQKIGRNELYWVGLRMDVAGHGSDQPVALALSSSDLAHERPSAKWSMYPAMPSCSSMSASTRENTASAKPGSRFSSSFKIAVMNAKAAVASVVVSLIAKFLRVSRGDRTIAKGGAGDSPVVNSRRRVPGGHR